MKASLKFKEDQTPPLLRVKVPLNILGYPFQSGVSACGDPKDLSLNLSTFFESGPSLKLVYKPNDSWNPFSLVIKTGIGPFGSPISAPLSMSAEFNLLSKGSSNPSFFLRFNPQFGDFSVKKSSGSQIILKPDVDEKIGWFGKFNGVDDVAVSARTVLPIRNRAVVKFSWGVRFPEVLKSDVSDGNLGVLKKIPFLVMNKLSIEHVARDDGKKEGDLAVQVADESWVGGKRQLDVLHAENGLLRRAVEDLKSEICAGKSGIGIDRRSGERKVVDEDENVGVGA